MGRIATNRMEGVLPTVTPGLYRHATGQVYKVLMTCLDTETRNEAVVYVSCDCEERIYVMPLIRFLGPIFDSKNNGEEVQRFRKLRREKRIP